MSKCPICGAKQNSVDTLDVLYDGVEVTSTKLEYKRCIKCESIYAVDKRRNATFMKEIYSSYKDDYWKNLNNQSNFSKALIDEVNGSFTGGELWDVGCGDGSLLKQFGSQWIKNGIEISPHAVELCKRKGIKVHQGTAIDLEFSNVADVIICVDVIEHLIHPQEDLIAMSNMLKKGGMAYFFTGNSTSINAKLNKRMWYYLHCFGHVSIFSKKAFKQILPKAGFIVEKIIPLQHDGSITFLKWAKRLLRNKLKRPVPVPYYHDHLLVIARKK